MDAAATAAASTRDHALYFSNKLAGEWSANSVTGLLSASVIDDISAPQKWRALDPLVRVRLLLSPMFLRRQELAQLRSSLTTLTAAALKDLDEWGRIMAAAVGPYDGVLHMDAVLEQSKLVRSTLEETRRHGGGANPSLFRPLEVPFFICIFCLFSIYVLYNSLHFVCSHPVLYYNINKGKVFECGGDETTIEGSGLFFVTPTSTSHTTPTFYTSRSFPSSRELSCECTYATNNSTSTRRSAAVQTNTDTDNSCKASSSR